MCIFLKYLLCQSSRWRNIVFISAVSIVIYNFMHAYRFLSVRENTCVYSMNVYHGIGCAYLYLCEYLHEKIFSNWYLFVEFVWFLLLIFCLLLEIPLHSHNNTSDFNNRHSCTVVRNQRDFWPIVCIFFLSLLSLIIGDHCFKMLMFLTEEVKTTRWFFPIVCCFFTNHFCQ